MKSATFWGMHFSNRFLWSIRSRFGFVLAGAMLNVATGCFAVSPIVDSDEEAPFSFSANVDGGYRETQFFQPSYNTGLLQWDSRIEYWAPPGEKSLPWGPYIRFAAVAGSRSDAFQNGILSGPGIGVQIYPFAASTVVAPEGAVTALAGPLRIFAESNPTYYWGSTNGWRPRHQTRAGVEYWKNIDVNMPSRRWWLETWNALYWQSSNEFTSSYDTSILANSWRVGIRRPGVGFGSSITPYLAAESSLTKNRTYYWENRLIAGLGLRYAPWLDQQPNGAWIQPNRFVIYLEYLRVAAYYDSSAPDSVPKHDLRVGIGVSFGTWYRR